VSTATIAIFYECRTDKEEKRVGYKYVKQEIPPWHQNRVGGIAPSPAFPPYGSLKYPSPHPI